MFHKGDEVEYLYEGMFGIFVKYINDKYALVDFSNDLNNDKDLEKVKIECLIEFDAESAMLDSIW